MARRITVFAGSGALVPHVVDAALRGGDKVQVLALTPRPDLAGVKVVAADIRNPLGLLWSLKTFRTTHVVMAGGISISDKVREDLARFAGARGVETGEAAVGDAASIAGLARAMKSLAGADLVGVHEIAPELLAGQGTIAGVDPGEEAQRSARFALVTARAFGSIDLGQAVVIAGARVIAAEDIAGTDELLARVARYRELGLVGDGVGNLVLAKASKPQQPLFVDLPAIGPDTVVNAAAAGIRLIVVEAGHTLLLDQTALFAAAKTHGVTILGMVATDG